MATLHWDGHQVPIPALLQWPFAALVALISALIWYIGWAPIQLWRYTTWPTWQLEDSGFEPRKFVQLCLCGSVALVGLIGTITWAMWVSEPGWYHWLVPVFVAALVYAVFSGVYYLGGSDDPIEPSADVLRRPLLRWGVVLMLSCFGTAGLTALLASHFQWPDLYAATAVFSVAALALAISLLKIRRSG